jgi:signal peptidase I
MDRIMMTSDEFSMTVPAGNYFLMGDNRAASLDSRSFGPVSERYFTGRVWLRAWPLDRWTTFKYADGSTSLPR